jgi:hypothetical protein
MAVTTRLNDEANALMEIYLGWMRAQKHRIDKGDAVSEFVSAGVRAAVPEHVLTVLMTPTKTQPKAKK